MLNATRVEYAGPLDAITDYTARGWTDGLPIVPPTPDLVKAALAATGLDGDDVLGTIATRQVTVTAEAVAINAVMAGCHPADVGVVIAAVRAMLRDRYNVHATSATLSGAVDVIVVNGPIRDKLGINCGDGILGPGSRPNATIGRAARLVLRNVCRAVPGGLDRASFSHPGRYSLCFGEDEEATPWVPLHVERGYDRAQSTVTVHSSWNTVAASELERDPSRILDRFARLARAATFYSKPSSFDPERGLVLVVGGYHHDVFVEAGFDKADLRRALFERLSAGGSHLDMAVPLENADRILVVRAGGAGMAQSWLMLPFPSSQPQTEVIDP